MSELCADCARLEAECLRLQQWDEKRIHEMKGLEERAAQADSDAAVFFARAQRAEAALKRIYARLEECCEESEQ